MSETGNSEGRNVIVRPLTDRQAAEQLNLSEAEFGRTLTEVRRRLAVYRSRRIPPALDDKVLTSWNGLVLASLADAARALRRPGYLKAAQRLAEFLLAELCPDGTCLRSWRQGRARYPAYLEDHAALGEGLLALYEADHDPRWFGAALTLAATILDRFLDPAGGFYDTASDHEPLIARPKGLQDTPVPSGSSLATGFLLRIAAFQGDARYTDAAEVALRAMQQTASRYPGSFPWWLCALDFALGPVWQLAIVGDPNTPEFGQLTQLASTTFQPRLVLAAGREDNPHSPSLLHARPMVDGRPTAYLCRAFECLLPTTSPQTLSAQLHEAFSLHSP